MHRGYIKIWRKMQDSGLQDNLELFGFFTNLVLMANHKEKKFLLNGNFITVPRGSLITGRNSLAKQFKVSPSKVWRMFDILKRGQIVDIKPNSKYSVVSICNYDKYQDLNYKIKQHTGQVANSKRTASEQQVNTNNNVNNVNNVKNVNKSSNSAEIIYNAYPRKVGKFKAIEAIEKSLDKIGFQSLLYKVAKYAKSVKDKDPKFTPHAATWFNQERWQDPIEKTPEQLEDEKQMRIQKKREEKYKQWKEEKQQEVNLGVKNIISDVTKKIGSME